MAKVKSKPPKPTSRSSSNKKSQKDSTKLTAAKLKQAKNDKHFTIAWRFLVFLVVLKLILIFTYDDHAVIDAYSDQLTRRLVKLNQVHSGLGFQNPAQQMDVPLSLEDVAAAATTTEGNYLDAVNKLKERQTLGLNQIPSNEIVNFPRAPNGNFDEALTNIGNTQPLIDYNNVVKFSTPMFAEIRPIQNEGKEAAIITATTPHPPQPIPGQMNIKIPTFQAPNVISPEIHSNLVKRNLSENETVYTSDPNSRKSPLPYILFYKTHKTGASSIQNMLFRLSYKYNYTILWPSSHEDNAGLTNLGYPRQFSEEYAENDKGTVKISTNNLAYNSKVLDYFPKNQGDQENQNRIFKFTLLREPYTVFRSIFKYYKYDKLGSCFKGTFFDDFYIGSCTRHIGPGSFSSSKNGTPLTAKF